uniref:PTH4 protein n=1 Tax=Strigops habroptila TaxID=2489341 RepID=A0A672UX98_STRHB
MVTLLAILSFTCFATCQDTGNKRAVTEHQLMHDKGREFQGLKRLMWLHNALGSVHTASSRDISLSNAMWDSQKSQDPSDLYNSINRDKTSSLMKQLLETSFVHVKSSPQHVEFSQQKNSFWRPLVFPERGST